MRRLPVYLIALALAGCGGDEAASEFRRAAEDNCKTRQASDLERQRTEPADAEFGDWIEAWDREQAAQRALEAPEALRTRWARYLGQMEIYLTSQREIIRLLAPLRKGYVNTSPLEAKSGRAGFLARQEAEGLKLPACAQFIY